MGFAPSVAKENPVLDKRVCSMHGFEVAVNELWHKECPPFFALRMLPSCWLYLAEFERSDLEIFPIIPKLFQNMCIFVIGKLPS